MTTAVEAIEIAVGYGSRPVAVVGSFRMEADRLTVVTGPNGSGKTTLLKTLAGLLPTIRGRIVPQLPAGTAGAVFVHSTPHLFAGTVRHNVQLTSRDDELRARDALRTLGVERLWGQGRPATVHRRASAGGDRTRAGSRAAIVAH